MGVSVNRKDLQVHTLEGPPRVNQEDGTPSCTTRQQPTLCIGEGIVLFKEGLIDLFRYCQMNEMI